MKLLALSLLFLFAYVGCVVSFVNSRNHVSPTYSKIYVPSANDSSVYAGNSSRLSFAIRSVLSRKSDIQLSSLNEARVALQIKILNRQQTIVAVDNCLNPGTPTVGSGAFQCQIIHPDIMPGGNLQSPVSFNQPSVSPKNENLSLVVEVRAIDLNDGKVLWAKHYNENNIFPIVFNEIGDNGDGRTMLYMAPIPNLHNLRYQEAIDNAVLAFSNAIANDLQNSLIPSLPAN